MSASIRHIGTRELLLNLRTAIRSPEKMLLKWSKGVDLTSVSTPNFSFLIVNNPLIAKELLMNHEEHMSKGAFFEFARESIGNGTLLADEPRHDIHLSAIRRAFSASQINTYVTTFEQLAIEEADNLTKLDAFDVKGKVQAFSLRAAMQTLFKSKSALDVQDFQSDFNHEAQQLTAERLLLGAIKRANPPKGTKKFGVIGRLENLLLSAALSAATKRVARPQNGSLSLRQFAETLLHSHGEDSVNEASMDVLSLLAQANVTNSEHWTKDALVDEILTLLLAGHETTASTLTWALLETSHAGLTPLPKDKIDQIILETLRLHPPAWVLPRVTVTDIETAGTTIPAQTNLLISPYLFHRDPQFFPRPTSFDPSRWDGIRFTDVPDAFMPFGVGPRGCIGQRFAFAEMRKYLEWFSETGTWKVSTELPVDEFHLTLRAKGHPSLVRK